MSKESIISDLEDLISEVDRLGNVKLSKEFPLLLYGRTSVHRDDEAMVADTMALLRWLEAGETLEQARERIIHR